MRQTCPICKKKDVVEAYRPFCSKRCADVDLGRWLKGGYAIPTDEHVPESEMPPTPANDSDVY